GTSRRVIASTTRNLRVLPQFSFTKTRAGEPRPIPLIVRHAPPAAPGLAALVTILVVASGFIPNAFILATGAVISAVARGAGKGMDSPAGDDLVTALIAVAVLFLAQQALGPFRGAAAIAWSLKFRARIGERVMRAVVTPPGIAHLEDPKTLDDTSRAQGVGPGGIGPSDALLGVVMLAELRFAAVVAAVILASFRWWLALALLAFRMWIRKTVWKQMAEGSAVALERTQQARFATYLRDLTLRPDSAKETRLFGLGPWIVGRFVTSWQETLDQVWRERRKGDARVLRGALYVFVADLIGFGVIARAAYTGELSPAQVAVFVQAVLMIATIGQMRSEDQLIQYGAAALPAALALDDAVAAVAPASLPAGSSTRPATNGAGDGAIRFERVDFTYPTATQPVLQQLDLEIPAGRSLAIVGSNGAGKTSLIKLLCGLYPPTAGRVTVDGTDLSAIEPRVWRAQIAAIFQDFTRYELSARDNVAFGAWAHHADTDALAAVAERANATAIVDHLPHGWDTILARQYDHGAELSGGQWQRIALARALFAVHGGARVLILDEPTAALDVRAEVELFDRFLELTAGLTTILVSHRFSTVRRADRIVVLDGGRVTETGSHDELVAHGGRYARMFELQAARFRDDVEVDE
ncbi:MAG: ATP-binding cassette, subfamily bacterial, partial [Actinomycetota bacterium]